MATIKIRNKDTGELEDVLVIRGDDGPPGPEGPEGKNAPIEVESALDISSAVLNTNKVYQLGELTDVFNIIDVIDPIEIEYLYTISILFTTSNIAPYVNITTDKIVGLEGIEFKELTEYEISLVYNINTNKWDAVILGDISNTIVSFQESTQPIQNISSGSSISTILGIIKKWYTDIISKVGTREITVTDTDKHNLATLSDGHYVWAGGTYSSMSNIPSTFPSGIGGNVTVTQVPSTLYKYFDLHDTYGMNYKGVLQNGLTSIAWYTERYNMTMLNQVGIKGYCTYSLIGNMMIIDFGGVWHVLGIDANVPICEVLGYVAINRGTVWFGRDMMNGPYTLAWTDKTVTDRIQIATNGMAADTPYYGQMILHVKKL